MPALHACGQEFELFPFNLCTIPDLEYLNMIYRNLRVRINENLVLLWNALITRKEKKTWVSLG